jgi:4-hydroxy-2-oxoglutarate aldolase
VQEKRRMEMIPEFCGVYAALTTPFENGEISWKKFVENILMYNAFDLAGYLVAGSTGEAPLLNDAETEQLVLSAVEAVSRGKKILVGTAKESAKLTIEFTNRIASYGIDAALIRTPSYFRSFMDRMALEHFFRTVADQSKVPVIIYHVPQNTGLNLDPNLAVQMSKHPNISGMKDSSAKITLLKEVISLVPPSFSYLLGAGNIFLPGLMLGASGGILRLADVAPDLCVKLYSLFRENRLDEALKIQEALIPLNDAIIQAYGIPGTKYALDLLGYHGGAPRSPLLPIEEEGKEEIRDLLLELKLIGA